MDHEVKTTKPSNIPKHVLALSWNIATEPKLYRQLAFNPYSLKAAQIFKERFPDFSAGDVIRAVILAEPEGKYDRNFILLDEGQQSKELLQQEDTSSRISKMLIQYCMVHANELSSLPKLTIYEHLSMVAFNTTDIEKIEEKYSQNQRLNFRLKIVDFIEALLQLKLTSGKKDNDTSHKGTAVAKPVLDRLFVKLTIASLALSLFFYFQIQSIALYKEQEKQVLGTEQKTTRSLPKRLKIPSINVDTAIEYVGLNPEGEMDAPSDTVKVGWYEPGSSPGEVGSAVISGHFDGRDGKLGVFNNLDKLKKGDKIDIINDSGQIITFIVRESRIYSPGYAYEVFLSDNSIPHLNLVTCDGVWNKDKKSYSKRLVVFTDILR